MHTSCNLDAIREQINQFANDVFRRRLVDTRRHLHANPELSGKETETTKYISHRMSELDIDHFVLDGGTGLVATAYTTKNNAPMIALRADIDALPIIEMNSVPYRSKKTGIMHACGHDAHTAMVIGAAELLLEISSRDPLPFHLRLIFQPSEETAIGAKYVIECKGIQDVSAVIGIHVDPRALAGQIGVRSGQLTCEGHTVEVKFNGGGGHPGKPHKSQNCGLLASEFEVLAHTKLSRVLDPLHPYVLAFTGRSFDGPIRPNIFPSTVTTHGSLRTLNESTTSTVKETLQQLSTALTQMNDGVTVNLRFDFVMPSVSNDARITNCVRQASLSLLDGDSVVEAFPSLGGEDFAFYLQKIPGCMFRLGTGGNGRELHSPNFDIDESALPTGSKVLALAAFYAAVSN